MDAINIFAKNFANTKYTDLPVAAVEAAKAEVLDSLATALGGSTKAGIPELIDIIKEWGGARQSTIIAYGIKCPAPNAAQVNGSMIHALDFDDGNQSAMVHTGCVTVSTCFAMAERMGGITGKEFITAICLGNDFMTRLSLAARPGMNLMACGWHPTALYGYLGAAAMSAKIMGLSEEKILNAMGIAYHQCAGNLQSVYDGALTKRMGPGLAAKGGITAALMAERGITGARNLLEGKFGIYNQYHAGDYNIKLALADLGKKFTIEDIGFKPFPCCGHTHSYIDAVFALTSKYNIKKEQVQKIIAYGGESAYALCTPIEARRAPRNIIDSQFSVPWSIAVAIVDGKVAPEHFTEEAIKREDILEISHKVTGQLDPILSRHGVEPGRLTIITNDGKEYTEEVQYCSGSTEKPMTFDDCAKKFNDCSASSVNKISDNTINKVVGLTRKLEQLTDATAIIRLLGRKDNTNNNQSNIIK